MKITNGSKQFEAVALTIASGMQQMLQHYAPGKTIEYHVVYGTEGEDQWTRGKTEITQAHIEAALRMLSINGGKQ